MTGASQNRTMLRDELDLVDHMHAALRTLYGGVNALRHMAHSPDEVQAEELAMVAEVLDGAYYKLSGAHNDIDSAREASKAEILRLKARIAALEDELQNTPAGRLESLKAWENMIRATAQTALESLNNMGKAA